MEILYSDVDKRQRVADSFRRSPEKTGSFKLLDDKHPLKQGEAAQSSTRNQIDGVLVAFSATALVKALAVTEKVIGGSPARKALDLVLHSINKLV